jgi:hypothetical protein
MPALFNYKLSIKSDESTDEFNFKNIKEILADERFSHLGFTKNKMYYCINKGRKLFNDNIISLKREKVDLNECLIED